MNEFIAQKSWKWHPEKIGEGEVGEGGGEEAD